MILLEIIILFSSLFKIIILYVVAFARTNRSIHILNEETRHHLILSIKTINSVENWPCVAKHNVVFSEDYCINNWKNYELILNNVWVVWGKNRCIANWIYSSRLATLNTRKNTGDIFSIKFDILKIKCEYGLNNTEAIVYL